MNVLSCFDGMSCGQIALNRIGLKTSKYYASEVDKWAIKVTQANYPETIQVGDIENWREWDIDWSSIDLLIGGSPCQGFSFAGKQLAFDDPRSKLFFTWLDILCYIRSLKPEVKFLLENVKMKKEYLNEITRLLGVEPVFINSALVSAQNRQRYYWTNIGKIEQPKDKGVILINVLETDGTGWVKSHGEYKERNNKGMCIDANYHKGADNHGQRTLIKCGQMVDRKINPETGKRDDYNPGIKTQQRIEIRADDKTNCLSTVKKDNLIVSDYSQYRKLTPIECERLQTVLQYIKPVEIVLCLDQAKGFVSAVEKNPKLLKLVLSVGNKELKEYAKLASQSMKASQAQKKSTAQQNVDMQIHPQTSTCTSINQGGLSSTVNSAVNTTTFKQAENVVSSATQFVFINITEGRITHCGKEESRLTGQSYTEQTSGKIALKLCGNEMMESAEDALSALEMMQTNQRFTSITSFRLSIKNLEQMLIISYWFAKSVIDGFTQDTIKTKILYLNLIDGYTNHASNTQRYKMLGNGWTVDVIAHIFKHLL